MGVGVSDGAGVGAETGAIAVSVLIYALDRSGQVVSIFLDILRIIAC